MLDAEEISGLVVLEIDGLVIMEINGWVGWIIFGLKLRCFGLMHCCLSQDHWSRCPESRKGLN